jgi:NADH-quinone oxidoreductase subunit N
MILSLDESQALAPELVIVAGIILAIIVPNLGDARVRLPLTSLRIPILWGGRRFELTSDPRAPGVLSAIALVIACLLSGSAIESADGMSISGVIQVTGFSRFMSMIFTAALAMTAIASIYRIPSTRLSPEDLIDPDDSIESRLIDNRRQVDLHILLLMVALGMSLMALSSDLFFLIVCLELASMASYVLVGFHKETKVGGEAGAKYFIVGSIASATGIYGMSLLYIWSGSLDFDSLAESWSAMGELDPLAGIGVGLMLVAFGFKVSAAPFHLAAPDAYSGTNAPIAGMLATASKAMGFVAMMRVLVGFAGPNDGVIAWGLALAILAVITMTWGNLAALSSENPKRMLAYSSVAHAGYMLAALAALGSGLADSDTQEMLQMAIVFHLAVLVLFKLGAFLVLTLIEIDGGGNKISDLHGLARRDPIIATAMFVFMLSLAGIPPLSGFLSKFLMINGLITTTSGTGALDADGVIPWLQSVDPFFLLAIAIVLNSALSLFYYLRIGLVMFFEKPEHDSPLSPALGLRVLVIASMVLTVLFGMGPASQWLLALLETAIASF